MYTFIIAEIGINHRQGNGKDYGRGIYGHIHRRA